MEGRNSKLLRVRGQSEMVGYSSATGSNIPAIIIWGSLGTESALDPFGGETPPLDRCGLGFVHAPAATGTFSGAFDLGTH